MKRSVSGNRSATSGSRAGSVRAQALCAQPQAASGRFARGGVLSRVLELLCPLALFRPGPAWHCTSRCLEKLAHREENLGKHSDRDRDAHGLAGVDVGVDHGV
eukprot:3355358-Prymnesium_polylepis.2